jgi:FixJ family two-component response regulator
MDARATVYVIDDELSVVKGLARLLEPEGYEVRAYTSAEAFLLDHDPNVVGCLISDVLMPDMDGLELQRALHAAGCRRAIIFITGQGEISTAVAAMKAGAVTILQKPLTRIQLITAVKEAIVRDLSQRSIDEIRRGIEERLGHLTRREREVLDLLASGLRNKQIAATLGIAEKTVKVHRGRVMAKMKVTSLASLIALLAQVSHPTFTGGAARTDRPAREVAIV